jgi:flagellar basal-body rod protein FlgC
MSSILPAVDTTTSALQAERTRLEVIATNLANAQNTRDVNGQVYRRKQVVFESMINTSGANTANGSAPTGAVRVAKIVDDPSPLQVVHMPGHPHADANGNVTLPNVNVTEEMVDMMTASRSYEANLQALQTSRQLFNSSLKITSGS